MKLNELYEMLSFPSELSEILQATECGLTAEEFEHFSRGMRDKGHFLQTSQELCDALGEDENGLKMLKVMLLTACDSHKMYVNKKISDDIFADTMKCFLRFAREHLESYGDYGFDRGYWVGRQLSLLLFCIGELEYEMTVLNGSPAISLHIPSGADLSEEKVDSSLKKAKEFFDKYYPEYGGAVIYCESWLLSPALDNMLAPTSRIVLFKRRFDVIKWEEESDEYKVWVFKKPNIGPEDFDETTSLQRSIKKHVLAGGKIGSAFGILKSRARQK